MLTAYSYIRFSTPEQRKGDSLRRQIELSEEYASENNLILDNSLNLQDLGISAFDKANITRGALGAFLEGVRVGRIKSGSYLLIESLDRLSRAQVLDALEVFISILRQGITIVTLGDKMVYNTESVASNFGNLIISITIMARAHEESATKSRRIKAAWKSKRKKISDKKLTAKCPGWMVINESKTEFNLIEEKVKLVHEVIDLALSGMGQAQIAKRLNLRAEPTLSGGMRGWHGSSVQKILTSKALYGAFQPHIWESGKSIPNGDLIEGYFPSVISREKYMEIQLVRAQRLVSGAKAKKGTTVPNLLSGVVKCGYCGSTMILATAPAKRMRQGSGVGSTRNLVKNLICDYGRRGLGCYAIQWNYRDFERSFLTFCESINLEEVLQSIENPGSLSEQKLSLKEELGGIDLMISETMGRLDNLLNALQIGEPPIALLEKIREQELALDELKRRREQLELSISSLINKGASKTFEIDSIRNLINRLDGLGEDDLFRYRVALADHIRRVIDVIKVYPSGRLTSLDLMHKIESGLVESGYSESDAKEFIAENYKAEPKRQDREHGGRYASRKDVDRFFVIQSKNGSFCVAYPEFDDPSQVKFKKDFLVK